MRTVFKTTALLAWLVLPMACAAPARPALRTGAPASLPAFASEAELAAQFARWRAQAEKRARETPVAAVSMPAPMAPAQAATTLDSITLTGSRVAASDESDESVTNNQTQGVDEGDIVKRAGDFLVVLRRGRLFTVRVSGDRLERAAQSDAYAPGVDPGGTWYDEMLVSDDTVVVIGYSYARGGTEVGVFALAPDGQLRHRDTYQLRSNDYYSARNYASRLVGDTLVFYTPLGVDAERADYAAGFPALRRWHAGATPADFHRLLPATRVYRGGDVLDPDDLTLHTVTRCDLAAPVLQCDSSAVLGPASRSFYVSENSVYVWTSPGESAAAKEARVFRLPLDGGAPSALRVRGAPIDQMSFLQRDGWLSVLVGAESGGDGMWASNVAPGALALLRVPLSAFGDGSARAPASAYRALPGFNAGQHALHNRFVGDWLLLGAGEPWAQAGAPREALAVRYAGNDAPQRLALAHDVERIEALGAHALLVGRGDDGLVFTGVRLDGARARAVSRYVQAGAVQGDDRTHGFFYRPHDADAGTLGLPVVSEDTASVLYLRNRSLRLDALGRLEAGRAPRADDDCRASCVDWYGNARPLFLGERVFALLGYELVEGQRRGERLVERRRLQFAPVARAVQASQ